MSADLSLFLFGGFQKHVSQSRFFSIPPDGVIFDIGANAGIMSLQFARPIPQGRVYSFEPTHFAFVKLQKNAMNEMLLMLSGRHVKDYIRKLRTIK